MVAFAVGRRGDVTRLGALPYIPLPVRPDMTLLLPSTIRLPAVVRIPSYKIPSVALPTYEDELRALRDFTRSGRSMFPWAAGGVRVYQLPGSGAVPIPSPITGAIQRVMESRAAVNVQWERAARQARPKRVQRMERPPEVFQPSGSTWCSPAAVASAYQGIAGRAVDVGAVAGELGTSRGTEASNLSPWFAARQIPTAYRTTPGWALSPDTLRGWLSQNRYLLATVYGSGAYRPPNYTTHQVVIYDVGASSVSLMDPVIGRGYQTYSWQEFKQDWLYTSGGGAAEMLGVGRAG